MMPDFLHFENPYLLLVIPIAWALLAYAHLGRTFATKNKLGFALKAAALLAFALAASDLQVKSFTDKLYRAYLVDGSGSVFLDRDKAAAAISANASTLAESDRVSVVLFGEDATVEATDGPASSLTLPKGLVSNPGANSTDLSAALRAAISDAPDGYFNEIVLLTDGNFTDDSWKNTMLAVSDRKFIIKAVPLVPDELTDLMVMDASAPQSVPPGSGFEARVKISSTVNAESELSIAYADSPKLPIASVRTSLMAGKPVSLALSMPAFDGPFKNYIVNIKAPGLAETCLENNSMAFTLRAKERFSCIVLTESATSPLAERLAKSFPKIMFAARQGLSGLNDFDCLIVDGFAAERLTEKDAEEIMSFAGEYGKGLLFSGGPRSFASGGFSGSKIEEMMPVYAAPRDEFSVLFLIDSSGSMEDAVGGKTKFLVACDAVASSLKVLSPLDIAGVATFSSGATNMRQAVLMGPVSEMPGLLDQLRGIKPSGGTEIIPPVEFLGAEELLKSGSPRKHIVLITDGESHEKKDDFARLALQLRDKGISISVLATRETLDDKYWTNLLMLTSNQTNGRCYKVDRSFDIAAMLRSDLASSKELIAEGRFAPEVKDIPELLLPKSMPDIGRYNRTTLKAGSAAYVVMPSGEPLLSSRAFRWGRVFALATSIEPGWAGNMGAWEDFGPFMSAVLAMMMRNEDSPGFALTHAWSDGEARFTVRITDRESLTKFDSERSDLEIVLARDTDSPVVALMRRTGYDSFEAKVELPEMSSFLALLRKTTDKNPEGEVVLSTRLSSPYASEWANIGLNRAAFSELARFPGVEEVDSLQAVKRPEAEVESSMRIGVHLIIAGLVLLLIAAWVETR